MPRIVEKTSLPPADSNALATALGKKLRKIIRYRKLELREAARTMGLDPGHVFYIITGRAIPNEAVSARLLDWMRGVDHSKSPTPSMAGAQREKSAWPIVKTRMPADLVQRLRREAKRQGVSIATFVQIAIERLLDNKPFLATMQEAKRQVEKARQVEILRQTPSLQALLQFEDKLAIRAGGQQIAAEEIPQLPIEQLLKEPIGGIIEEEKQWWQDC